MGTASFARQRKSHPALPDTEPTWRICLAPRLSHRTRAMASQFCGNVTEVGRHFNANRVRPVVQASGDTTAGGRNCAVGNSVEIHSELPGEHGARGAWRVGGRRWSGCCSSRLQSGRASNADFRSSEPLNLALSALPWLPDLRRSRGLACRSIRIGRSGRPNHGSAGAVVRAGDADELQKKMGKSPRSSGQTLRNRCCYARVPVNHCVTAQLVGARGGVYGRRPDISHRCSNLNFHRGLQGGAR